MRKMFFCLVNLALLTCSAQQFQHVDTLDHVPPSIQKLVPELIDRVYSIDIDADGNKDFLVHTIANDQEVINEYWISSNFKILITTTIYESDIHVMKFMNLDNDPELEVINAAGYEDGIDYFIENLDLINGRKKTLFYFNPIIKMNDHYYWGYPWNISSLITKKNNNRTEILVSLDHSIIRDGNIKIPENQLIMPCLFFEGSENNAFMEPTDFKSFVWQTIDEIDKRVK